MIKCLKVLGLKDIVNDTLSFVTWSCSVGHRWNVYISDFRKLFEEAFFLNSTNEYDAECGWYVKTDAIKETLEIIKEKLKKESKHDDISYVTDKYNTIVKYVNEKAEEQVLPELITCENVYCIYSRNGVCCNPRQHEEKATAELDCELAIRADYDILMTALRRNIEIQVRNLTLIELLEINSMCESFGKMEEV